MADDSATTVQTPLPPNIPSTQLPFLDTTLRSPVASNEQKKDSLRFDISANEQPVAKGIRTVLERFALFVSAVADSENVAFVASTADPPRASAKKLVGYATIPDQGQSVSPESQLALTLIEGEYLDQSLDFEIEILPRGAKQGKIYKKAFSLSLLESEADGLFDICLSFSSSHGSKAAAEHLFQLALFYLRTRETLATNTSFNTSQPKLSIFNSPQTALTPLPLPWDQPSSSPATPLLHAAFNRRVAEFPDRIAIEYLSPSQTGQSPYSRIFLTYREVNARVSELALGLEKTIQKLDWPAVKGNQRIIPMFMSACPEQYISCLAILKAGHAFCSLPVDAPQERLKELLEDLGSRVVLGVGSERFRSPGSVIKSGRQDKLESLVWLDVLNVKQWFEKDSVSVGKAEASMSPTQPQELTGDDLAYVFYTSGSTGRPKGVQTHHFAATCSVSSHVAMIPGLSEEAPIRWFQLTAPTFDPFILEVFIPLSAGGTICAAEREVTLTDVEGAINALKANTTHTVPSLAMMFRPERMPTLKTLLCGGEKLSRKVIETFSFDSHHMSKHAKVGRDAQGLTNLYGPTECTIYVSLERFTSKTRGSIIGKVLPTCSVFLLDLHSDTLQPVPIGVPGHLAVGGPQVSPGYLNRPEENAQQFVSSPEFGRLYLTGDKARIVWNEKGEQRLEYMGRIEDTQVKLNGRRLELEEIDSVIVKVESVSDVATVTMEAQGGTQLVAFVALDSSSSAVKSPLVSFQSEAENACRKIAETLLPLWMNPQHYIFLPRLPRTASGKVLRKSLRETAKELLAHKTDLRSVKALEKPQDQPINSAADKGLPAPTDAELPDVLCHLLKKVLASNSADITPSTSLFALGFDSLRAIAFLQQARDRRICELAIHDMLKGLTPQELTEIIIDRRQVKKNTGSTQSIHQGSNPVNGEGQSSEVPPSLKLQAMLSGFDKRCRSRCVDQLGVPSEHIVSVYPTTYMQTRMVVNFLDSGDSSDPYVKRSWVEHFVYNVPESIDSNRFQEALSTVLKKHDCFRTVFTIVEDPVSPCAQCVLSPSCPEATIPWSNIYCDSAGTGKYSLFERTIENAQRTADEQMRLERPPVAVSFIRSRSGGQCVLVLSLFHGMNDAVSLKLFRKEVMAEYYNKPQPPSTPMVKAIEVHFGANPKATFMFWVGKLATVPYYKLTGVPKPQSSTTHSHAMTNGHLGNGVAVQSLEKPAYISAVSVTSLESKIRWVDLTKSAMHDLLTTPLSVVQIAWAQVLLDCQQKTDENRVDETRTSYNVTFGSTLHSRHDRETQLCMGLALTTIPMCIAGDTASEGAATNRKTCQIFAREHAEALEHLQLPCPSLEFARSLVRFDTNLILQTFGDDNAEGGEDFPGYENGANVRRPYRGSDFNVPVLIEILPGSGNAMTKLQCTFQNSSSKYPWLTDVTAKQLLEMFDANMAWIMANPDGTFGVEKRTEFVL